MLLSIFAFGLGSLIGRLRGGRWSGLTSARFHNIGFLIAGITSILVLGVIGPAAPLLWGIVGSLCLLVFGLRNLQITGMIVLLVGLTLNIAPMLANGATPVSEQALQSVGAVLEDGSPEITGLRESRATATRLGAFGDVIPVPIVNNVISIGDLIMLVALGDIAANLLLRARRREYDDAGVTFTTNATAVPHRPVSEVGPFASSASNEESVTSRPSSGRGAGRPAHAAHRRPRLKRAPSSHVPAHAIEPVIDLRDTDVEAEHVGDQAVVIKLDGPDAFVETPRTKAAEAPSSAADARPIIDLTTSPSDEQLCEFLRRRAEADERLLSAPAPGPSPRRGRAPKRRVTTSAEVAESNR